jgi:hypothetical protein
MGCPFMRREGIEPHVAPLSAGCSAIELTAPQGLGGRAAAYAVKVSTLRPLRRQRSALNL